MKALILAGLLLSTAVGYADPSRFLLAVKDDKNTKTKSESGAWSEKWGWSVDIGDVYQFVRLMSASEYNGGTPDPNDQSYVVFQINGVQVALPATDFAPVEDKDLLQATTKYTQEVAQMAQASTEGVLSHSDRVRMLYFLRAHHVISSIGRGDQMSDKDLLDMYQKEKTAVSIQDAADAINTPMH